MEYLNPKYIEDQIVNILNSHESKQKTNMNSTIKAAANVEDEFNHSNENNDTKWKAFKT